MIRVATSIPEPFYRKAEYVFGFFSHLWGIPVKISRDPLGAEKPDVLYSSDHEHRYQGAVCIPFDERLYDARRLCDSVQHDGLTL